MVVETAPRPVEAEQPQAQAFELQTSPVFFRDYVEAVQSAKERVYAQVMEWSPDSVGETASDAWIAAAKKGVDVQVFLDAYSKLVTNGYFNARLHLNREQKQLYEDTKRKRDEIWGRLTSAGSTLTITNMPRNPLDKAIPVRGRNHRKIFIVDDVAWMGGVNLTEGGIQALDFMVKTTDPAIVSALVAETFAVEELRGQVDRTWHLNQGKDTLLVDVGKPGQSIILDTATDLIRGAKKSVRVISQHIPNGDMHTALIDAHQQGKDVQVISHGIPLVGVVYMGINILNHAEWVMRKGPLVPLYQYPSYVHAKVIEVDDKWVLFGSNNFSERGVRAGTQEIALLSRDPDLVAQCKAFGDQTASKASPFIVSHPW